MLVEPPEGGNAPYIPDSREIFRRQSAKLALRVTAKTGPHSCRFRETSHLSTGLIAEAKTKTKQTQPRSVRIMTTTLSSRTRPKTGREVSRLRVHIVPGCRALVLHVGARARHPPVDEWPPRGARFEIILFSGSPPFTFGTKTSFLPIS